MRTFPNPTSPASDPAILNRTSHALEECPYGHTTNFFTKGSCVRSDAVRRFPALLRMAASDRQGATLLVTLGILTVLSVMVITYLVAARLQRQTAAVDQNRLVARNYMDAALHLAMRQVEDSLTYPNYSDHDISAGEYLTPQRLAPVDRWFGEHYSETNQLSKIISFQATDVLASPAFSNAPTVNLLTPQVLRLIPSALTNGLVLSSNALRPFRSGWIPLDILPDSAPTEMRLRSKSARIAFTVFNCSGLIDANTFLNGPTQQKLPRVCFNQTDVTNWVTAARKSTDIDHLNSFGKDEELPFFHLSYDPNPNIYPLHYDCFETCTSVGLNRFGAGPVIDLNQPQMYKALQVLQEHATYLKFNLNSITNFFARGTETTDTKTPWFNDAGFKSGWLDPVTFLIEMMRHEEPTTTLHRWPDSAHLAWTIANFMDADRIPHISRDVTDVYGNQEVPTRINYAVEDVPLINKVTVFNIFKPGNPGQDNPDAPQPASYYFKGVGETSNLSNHYAVAVELWYPFAPKTPRDNPACYVGIYTNASDVVTTINTPWSQNMLRDWLRWNYVDTSNTVMQTLFYSWGARYTQAVGPAIWSHPLWLTITTDSDLWFSTSMTNHMYWPSGGTNDTYDITANPIWQAFYPETYEEVVTNVYETVTPGTPPMTNQYEVVSTNVYTTLVVTNTVMDWPVTPDTTNRFINAFEGATPVAYPWILWSDTSAGTFSTNRITGFDLTDGTESRLSESNILTHFFFFENEMWVVVTNTAAGGVAYNSVSNLYLLDNASNQLTVSNTNLVFSEEITRVQPLPMPDDLGLILNGLMGLLPTNSVSSLYEFLMATPDNLDPDAWNRLFTNLSQIPGILNRLFPSNREPTLGNMTENDRHALADSSYTADNGDVNLVKDLSPTTFKGYYWTVYPKQVVTFMEVVETVPVDGQSGANTEYRAVTNYQSIGLQASGKTNEIRIRPVTTITPGEEAPITGGGLLDKEVIVDEALLSPPINDHDSVWGWTSVTNIYIPDPRDNACATNWLSFPYGALWATFNNNTKLSTGVHELPFIHFDSPFSAIGDIGHIYASYTNTTVDSHQTMYDTLTFTTRAGAALLDIFTLSPTNGPMRGLVQANTQQRPVVQTLLSDVKVGWTNKVTTGIDNSGCESLYATPGRVEKWADVYADALTNSPYSMGWRSYADMLPNLSTNHELEVSGIWNSLHPMHDYTEDVLRGLIDKVSFRQNIFVIVVAVQALSPASTVTHPITLADQRAAVTVIRDAYTGKWLIHSWVWLTE